MRVPASIALALFLPACTLPWSERVAPAPAAASVCRTGPDGGPALADRGIGGTGAAAGPALAADKGIGGTGIEAGLAHVADRGIGGTGVEGVGMVGVVTGFASICLDGHEVALPPAVPILIDGTPASAAALRAGQLAAVEASGPAEAPTARQIAVRHEVSGPVDALDSDGTARVAGQTVMLAPDSWGRAELQPGRWVAVSGLRQPNGVILATRIDPRPAGGAVTVHGRLQRAPDNALRIGALPIRLPAGAAPPATDRLVTASGQLDRGVLLADEVVDDLLALDPSAYFGGAVSVLFVEGVVSLGDGRFRLGHGRAFAAPPGFGMPAPGRAVIRFDRSGPGTFVPTGIGPGASGPAAGFGPGRGFGPAPRSGAEGGRAFGPGGPGRSFQPAPMPDRRFDAQRGGFGGPSAGGGRPPWGDRFGPATAASPGQNGSRPGPGSAGPRDGDDARGH